MKFYMISAILFVSFLMAGCNENMANGPDRHMINSELVNSYNNIAVHNAVITQHTLFPYHFVKNGADLNELGSSDLKVLTGHFLKYPGRLNIRRGDTPENLYQARTDLVLEKMLEAGLESDKVRISDDMPGGPGMYSEKILTILENGNNDNASSGRITR
ncbi:MAG: hypothetical protein ACYTBV_08530 [Planctomycetota bacterium]|jgi:hypothetical protein